MNSAGAEIITVGQLASRLDISSRRAAALMRKMRHVQIKQRLWTTEGWLAEWLAAESIPAQNWPPKGQRYDPLEVAVNERVLDLIRRMADAGAVRVVSVT
jgi:hypothetical protein